MALRAQLMKAKAIEVWYLLQAWSLQ